MKNIKKGDTMQYKDSTYLIECVVGEYVFYSWADMSGDFINTSTATKTELEKAGYAIKPMENKDWKKQFDTQFRVGYQWKDDEFVDISKWGEIKSFFESYLKSKQEEMEKAMENMKRKELSSVDVGPINIPDIETQGYNQAVDDLKPIISNILK